MPTPYKIKGVIPAPYKLKASAAEQWMTCPGSLEACDGLPDTTSGFADEGSCASMVLECVLKERYEGFFADETATAFAHVGRRFNVARKGEEPRMIACNEEMATHVQTLADYVAERKAEMEGQHGEPVVVMPEKELTVDWRIEPPPEADIDSPRMSRMYADIVLACSREIEVVDMKYGRGVTVEVGTPAEPNKQLMHYLIGVLGEHRYQAGMTCRLTIFQPRKEHPAGAIRSCSGIEIAHVTEFVDKIEKARAAVKPGAPRIAGEKACRFCKAKSPKIEGRAPCREYIAFAADQAAMPSPPVGSKDPDVYFTQLSQWATGNAAELAEADLIAILRAADLVRGMLTACEEHAVAVLQTGNAGPMLSTEFKLVQGNSHRAWAFESEESVAAELSKIRWTDAATQKSTALGKKVLYDQKLKSPAAVERLLKAAAKANPDSFSSVHWDAFKRLVTKPGGALKLAPMSDPRPAVAAKDPTAALAQAGALTAPEASSAGAPFNPFAEIVV